MKEAIIKIKAEKEQSYPVLIGENLIDNAYQYIKEYTKANKFLLVTNEKVEKLYGELAENKNTYKIILPDGEVYKNMQMLNKIIDKAIEIKLERKDAIIALGGGVIGDMAGFAASIYERGIDFIQIPTTLLAQVDSSVGGKVAVNHKYGKNMIGNFYQPKLVLADTKTLKTLDERQFKTGLAEVLKYAFIEKSCQAEKDYKLFEFLEANISKIQKRDTQIIQELIYICCSLKSSVVNKDEKEKGLRAILNFGHTYAHAIEKLTEYNKYTHGEAVSIGMKMVFNLALNIGYINKEYYERCIQLITKYKLKTELEEEFNKEIFYESMKNDKKVSNGEIKFVIPIKEKEVEIINKIDKNNIIQGI